MNGTFEGVGEPDMKTVKAAFLWTLIMAALLFAGSAGGETDIACHEYGAGPRGSRAAAEDEVFDPSLYGENGDSLIYVSVSGNDIDGNGTREAPYVTLRKAVSSAAAGDTIRVGAGVYVFTESLDLPVGVSLEGEGTETVFTSSVLTADDIGGGIALVRLHSEEDAKEYGCQHISHITFDGRQTAAWAIDVANRHNVSVHDCTIVDFCEAGVGWHATDLSRQSIEDTNPDVTAVNGTFVTGGRFYNNFMRDNTRFDGWGRGALFLCGLEDFRIYGNTIIEDVRTSPTGTRGVPVKAWYYAGWMRDIRIHDNDIQRLGSALHSSDGSGWDFAIEMAAPYTGLEIYNNHFIGSVDLNGGVTAMGGAVRDYSAWIHDNRFTADPEPKYEDGTAYYNEEYAFTLERVTQRTLIEYNTVTGYDTVLYFNGRQEISDVTFRYNRCTELGGQGGGMFRMDGRSGNGFEDHITVTNLTVSGNIFSSVKGNGASGFGIILGQEMACAWSGENIEISNNTIEGCVYPYWFAVTGPLTALSGLRVENNLIHGENGILVPEDGVTGFVYADNRVLNDAEWAAAFENGGDPERVFPANGGVNR